MAPLSFKNLLILPMGSPFSPILADLVMDDLEKEKLANLDFEVPVYLHYVDDILIVTPSTQVDRILQSFNANPLNIKFTLEKGYERAIKFMDIPGVLVEVCRFFQ